MTDSELIDLYLQGNEKAFGVVVTRHTRALIGAIIKRGIDPVTAEDIAQDAILRAMVTIKNGGFKNNYFKRWLIRIATNLAADHFRGIKRRPVSYTLDKTPRGKEPDSNHPVTIAELQIGTELSPEDSTIFNLDILARYGADSSSKEMLMLVLECLPEEQREIMYQRYFFGKSFLEISALFDLNINTALGRVRYALNNIRTYLNKNPHIHEVLLLTIANKINY